jgi:AcrR family transcriptional regulator
VTSAPPRAAPAPQGYARARARTRAGLLAAAREVMADKGVEGATIVDIAARAGVSPGTFYNHFGAVPAVLDALVDDLLVHLDEVLDEVTRLDCTPPERFAIGVDRVLRLADEDPVWAWCMVRFEPSVLRLREALGARVTANIRAGAESGDYARHHDPVVNADILIGTLVTSSLSRLHGRADASQNHLVAEALLRALGVPAAEAHLAVDVIRRAAAVEHA